MGYGQYAKNFQGVTKRYDYNSWSGYYSSNLTLASGGSTTLEQNVTNVVFNNTISFKPRLRFKFSEELKGFSFKSHFWKTERPIQETELLTKQSYNDFWFNRNNTRFFGANAIKIGYERHEYSSFIDVNLKKTIDKNVEVKTKVLGIPIQMKDKIKQDVHFKNKYEWIKKEHS